MRSTLILSLSYRRPGDVNIESSETFSFSLFFSLSLFHSLYSLFFLFHSLSLSLSLSFSLSLCQSHSISIFLSDVPVDDISSDSGTHIVRR